MRLLARLLWAVRGKRRVRLHLLAPDGAIIGPSFEGVLVGCWGGHYVLLAASFLESEDRTHSLQGHTEIPRERVIAVQVLP